MGLDRIFDHIDEDNNIHDGYVDNKKTLFINEDDEDDITRGPYEDDAFSKQKSVRESFFSLEL